MRLNKISLGPKLYVIFCFIFFYLPIAVTMFFSFNSSKSLTKFTGFSLQWYEKLISDQSILAAVYVSVSIAIFATIASTVLGTITAIGLSKSRRLLKEWILNINNVPIMNPDIVTAISLMIIFTSARLERGYITMLLAHIVFCTPFVITSVYPKVRSMDHNLANAALDLGATPFQTLTKVVVPLLKPGIFAGMLLAFTMSLDDFIVSYFVTGNGVSNISILVYNMTKRINPTINALSSFIIVAVAIVLVLVTLQPVLKEKRKAKRAKLGREARKRAQKRRRIVNVFIGTMAIVLAIVCMTQFVSISHKQVLRVFNSGEYMDMNLVADFEKKYNCEVVYETYDSNESMYTKLQSGSTYDILVPSDYMIERLSDEKYLQKLDWSKITNKDNIIPSLLKDSAYDPGNKYSVPYYWGNVGILYNKKSVSKEDLKAGWEVLRNTKYKDKLYMYDSERDSFMIALKALGYSMNTTNKKELQEAYKWLIKLSETMNPVYVGDDVMDNMISGNKELAVVYSGDAAYIINENKELGYYVPEEGTNMWTDGMVITKSCKNTDLAYKFMNYFLNTDVAITNTEYIGYDSAVKGAYNYYKNVAYKGNEGCAPKNDNPGNEVFHNQRTSTKKYMSNLWTKVKSHK